MQIVIGSYALHYWGLTRKPVNDIDYWSDHPIKKGDSKVLPVEILNLVPTKHGFATPNALYTIKCSHLGWSNHNWQKHKEDILWLKSNNCELIPELYNALIEYWKKTFGNKEFLSLDKSKEKFFQDFVSYQYDHDDLHELVAYPNKPLYTKCLKENEDILISKEKFNMLSFDDKIKLFKEEITVIACERWLLNKYWNGDVSWYRSYMLALQKTITNLTKNWATDFIVLNLEHFTKPDYSLFKHTIEKLGDNTMSKVDMKIFEDLMIKLDGKQDYSGMDGLIYCLCENSFWGGTKDIIKEFGYEQLAQEGGGEGGAEYCFGVFKLGDKVYKAEYRYYSYNGHEFDGISNTLKEVKPKTKTITVYE